MTESEAMAKAKERLTEVGFDPLTILTIISILISAFKLCKDWVPTKEMGTIEKARLRRQFKKHGIKNPAEAVLNVQKVYAQSSTDELAAFATACCNG